MIFFSKSISSDEDMYKVIYDTYRERVFLSIARKVKDRNDIMDILQNVFVHLWQYRKSLGGPDTENIIFKTCNQEISYFMKKSVKDAINIDTYFFEKADESDNQLENKLEEEKQIKDLNEWIEMLPLLRKQIFTMNKLKGISQEQIAKELNLSRSAVENQISKAMLFLKKNHFDP